MDKKINSIRVCPECEEKTKSGHLVPPSMGDSSFWICKEINRMEQADGMPKNKDWSNNNQ